jgi:hypothetical protein
MKPIFRIVLVTGLILLAGCANKQTYARAVYVLVDTSGTYAQEVGKAQQVINYLLGTLNPGDSLAVARVKSRSFTEKDIVAKATFSKDPLEVNGQKRAFQEKMTELKKEVKGGTAYTDITGGVLQASEFLNETGAGRKTIVIFSDMQEELDKRTIRDIPLNLTGISVVALNVTKLNTDNTDPRRYTGRLDWWKKRCLDAGAKEWRVINDLEHLERIFD